VFTSHYLGMLARQDEPGGAGEGELAGPWRVVEAGPAQWDVVRLWEDEGMPRCSAQDRETALLFAATLPAVGRTPVFRTAGPAVDGRRSVESEGRKVAELAMIGDEAAAAAHVAACLARSPWGLALLLQAAGPAVQREVGEILFRGVEGRLRSSGER
jgi:hypothetical protein